MEWRNGPSRAMGFVAIARNYQRGTAVALHHSGRCDSNDSTVPAISIDDQAESVFQCGVPVETSLDSFQNAAFFFLAFRIELVEAAGNLTGAFRIFHAEQFHHVSRDVHTASRIDPRRKPESNFGGCQRPPPQLRRLQ